MFQGFSVPTRLIAATKYPLATAWAGCSSSHRYSESPATVADGLNTISAPLAEDSRAFREVTVIANINADSRVLCFKHWIAEIAGCEIKLLPKSGMTMRNVVLAIFAKIPAVGVDYRSCIEIHARHLFFVDGNHNHHAMFRGDFLHQLSRRPVGHALREFVPTCVLLRTKIRPEEKFLQAKDLCLFLSRLLDQLEMLVDHRLPDLRKWTFGANRVTGLDQGAADIAGHGDLPVTYRSRNETIARSGLDS